MTITVFQITLSDRQIDAINAGGWVSDTGRDYAKLTLGTGTLDNYRNAWIAGMIRPVADVDGDDFDVAFEQTNHIWGAWQDNDGVTAFTDCAKSTSVGDILMTRNKFYVVASFGFKELDLPFDMDVRLRQAAQDARMEAKRAAA